MGGRSHLSWSRSSPKVKLYESTPFIPFQSSGSLYSISFGRSPRLFNTQNVKMVAATVERMIKPR